MRSADITYRVLSIPGRCGGGDIPDTTPGPGWGSYSEADADAACSVLESSASSGDAAGSDAAAALDSSSAATLKEVKT